MTDPRFDLQRTKAELAALAEAVRLLTGTLDLPEVLDRLTELVRTHLGVDVVRIWLAEGAPGEFHLKAQAGVTATPLPHRVQLGLGQGLVGWIMAHRKPLELPDLQADPQLENRDWMKAEGLVSFLGIPLLVKDKPVGVLAVMTRTRRVFAPEETSLAEALAVPAAIAIENARLYQRAAERARKLTALSALTWRIASAPDSREVFPAIAYAATTLLGAQVAEVWVDHPAEQLLRVQARVGLDPKFEPLVADFCALPYGRGAVGLVFQSRAPEYFLDIQDDSRWLNQRLAKAADLHACAAVPLITGDRGVGVLLILFGVRRDFTPEEKELIRLLADQAAIAIEKARLYEEARSTAKEAQALLETTQALTSALDVSALLDVIAESATRVLGAQRSAVFELDPRDSRLHARASRGMRPDQPFIPMKLGQGAAGSAALLRKPVFSPDVLARPLPMYDEVWEGTGMTLREVVRRRGYRAILAVPLVSKETVFGTICVYWDEVHDCNEREVEILTGLARQAAVAIENARLLQELKVHQARLEALLEVNRQFSRIQPLESLLGQIAEACGYVLNADSVSFRLVEGNDLILTGNWGLADAGFLPRLKIGESLVGVVASTGEALMLNDPASDPRMVSAHREAHRRLGTRAFLGVPIKVGEQIAGVLSVRTRRPEGFSEKDQALATAFASQAATALENARVVKSLQQAVDDLKAAQEQLVRGETLRAVGELASGMAHHLNNLLAVILGRVQLLLAKIEAPETRRSLEIIERTTLDGAEVVRRVQGFARIRPISEPVSVDLNEVAREVLELTQLRWQREAQVRGIQIEASLEPGAIPAVTGDPASLREVLMNLVLNAIDALPKGGRITVKTWASDGRVQCAVTDNGVGMSEEVRQRALEPFFTTKGPRSTGLGLSVSYGIMRRHGGDLSIKSAPGSGTTVTISLPFSEVAATLVEGPVLAAPPIKIMIIDDEPEVRQTLAEILAGQGHIVSQAASGAEGISQFQAARHDLVLTDLVMPEMTGWRVAAAIKALSPETPVILVTGWDQQEAASVEAGHVDAVLTKPFHTAQVAAMVARALAKRWR